MQMCIHDYKVTHMVVPIVDSKRLCMGASGQSDRGDQRPHDALKHISQTVELISVTTLLVV